MMPKKSALDAGPVRFERVYDAPIEDVWALWTTKEGLEAWFAPEGMRLEVTALEPWVGGAFDYVMTAVGAAQFAYLKRLGMSPTARVKGRLMDLELHRRLRICFDMDFVPGTAPYPYNMLVEMEIIEGRVRTVLAADRHPDPEINRGAMLGLTSQLERFILALAVRAAKQERR